jgi:hypothetical protein
MSAIGDRCEKPPHPDACGVRPLPRGERARPCGSDLRAHHGLGLPSPLAGEGGEAKLSRVRGIFRLPLHAIGPAEERAA